VLTCAAELFEAVQLRKVEKMSRGGTQQKFGNEIKKQAF
jgi:hypothetical protein